VAEYSPTNSDSSNLYDWAVFLHRRAILLEQVSGLYLFQVLIVQKSFKERQGQEKKVEPLFYFVNLLKEEDQRIKEFLQLKANKSRDGSSVEDLAPPAEEMTEPEEGNTAEKQVDDQEIFAGILKQAGLDSLGADSDLLFAFAYELYESSLCAKLNEDRKEQGTQGFCVV
jgi:hypothetical protein